MDMKMKKFEEITLPMDGPWLPLSENSRFYHFKLSG
jgi:hypothetical protein